MTSNDDKIGRYQEYVDRGVSVEDGQLRGTRSTKPTSGLSEEEEAILSNLRRTRSGTQGRTTSLLTHDDNGEMMGRYYDYINANYRELVERTKESRKRAKYSGGLVDATELDKEARRVAKLNEFLRKVFDEESQRFMKKVLKQHGKSMLRRKNISKYPVPPTIRTKRGAEDGVVSWITIREGRNRYRHVPILKKKLKKTIMEAKRLEAEDEALSESLLSEIYANAFKQYRNHNTTSGDQEWLLATMIGDTTEHFFEKTYGEILGQNINDLSMNDLMVMKKEWVDWRTNERKVGSGLEFLKARIDELMNAPSWFGHGKLMMKAEADYRFTEAEWIKSFLRKLGDEQLIKEYRESRLKDYATVSKMLQEMNMTVDQMIEKTKEDSMLRPRCTMRDVELARASDVLRFHLYAMEDLKRYLEAVRFIKSRGYEIVQLPEEDAFNKLRDSRLEQKSMPEEIESVYRLEQALLTNDKVAMKKLKAQLLEGFQNPKILEKIEQIKKEIEKKRESGLDTKREKRNLIQLYEKMLRRSQPIPTGHDAEMIQKAIGELEAEGLIKTRNGKIIIAKDVAYKPDVKAMRRLKKTADLLGSPLSLLGKKAEAVDFDKKTNTLFQYAVELPINLPKGDFKVHGKIPIAKPVAMMLDKDRNKIRFYKFRAKKSPAYTVDGLTASAKSETYPELVSQEVRLMKAEPKKLKSLIKEKPIAVVQVPKKAISEAIDRGGMTIAVAKKGVEVCPAGKRKPIVFGGDAIKEWGRLPRREIKKKLVVHWATPMHMKKTKAIRLGVGKSYAFIEAKSKDGVVRNCTFDKSPE